MKRRFLALDSREKILAVVLVLMAAILTFGFWWGFTPREEKRIVYLRWFEGDTMLVGEDKQEVHLSEKETLFWARALDTYRGLDGLIFYDENY